MSKIVGGCLCGKIRYTGTTDPVMTAICHCKNCQKQAGTAFSVIVAVPKTTLTISGPLKTYNETGSSGKPVHRNFCPECGSPITTDVEVMPDLVFIKAGTLDDTSWLQPSLEIWCRSAQSWTPAIPGAQRLDRGPS